MSDNQKIYISKGVYLEFKEEANGKYSFSSNDSGLQEWCESVKTKQIKGKDIKFVVGAAKKYQSEGKSNAPKKVENVQQKNVASTKPTIDPNTIGGWKNDPVSALNQYCQKAGLKTPEYRTAVQQAKGENVVTVTLVSQNGKKISSFASNAKEAKKKTAWIYAFDVLGVSSLEEMVRKIKTPTVQDLEESAIKKKIADLKKKKNFYYESESQSKSAEKGVKEDIRFEEKNAPWYVCQIDSKRSFIEELDNDNIDINDKYTYFDIYGSTEKPQSLFRFALVYSPEVALAIAERPDFVPDAAEIKDFMVNGEVLDIQNFAAQSIRKSLEKSDLKIDNILSKEEAEKIFYKPTILSDSNYSETVSLLLDHSELDINQTVRDEYGNDYYKGKPLNFLAYAGNKDVFEKALNRPKTDVLNINPEWDCDGDYSPNPVYNECKKLLKDKQAQEMVKSKQLLSNLTK